MFACIDCGGNPVISSEGESCAIHSSLKKDL
jgi:hypothetical protein